MFLYNNLLLEVNLAQYWVASFIFAFIIQIHLHYPGTYLDTQGNIDSAHTQGCHTRV